MKASFRPVIEAALEGDQTLTKRQREKIRDILNGGDICEGDVEKIGDPGIEPLLLTQRQACRALGVSRFTIYRMVRDGLLHPVSIRGARRYQVQEIRNVSRTGVSA